jgi:hypothetical protein
MPPYETIKGRSVIPKAQAQAYMKYRCPNNPDISDIVGFYYDGEIEFGVRADILLSDAIIETSFPDNNGVYIPFNSFWSLPGRRNFAGVGVTGQTVIGTPDKKPPTSEGVDWAYNSNTGRWEQGLTVGNWMRAVYLHGYHMKVYTTGTKPDFITDFFDIRAQLTYRTRLANGLKPAVTVADLAGTWAADTSYAGKIQNVYSTILNWKGK